MPEIARVIRLTENSRVLSVPGCVVLAPSCGLPKGHDRQRDSPRHRPALEFEADAFNLTGQPMSDGVRSHRLGPPLLMALLAAGPVQAQIVTDGSVGPKVSLSGGEIKIGADLGTRRGANLFHSFEKFGIAPGQTATFTGPGEIKNVISRVTGGEVSNIDDTLLYWQEWPANSQMSPGSPASAFMSLSSEELT